MSVGQKTPGPGPGPDPNPKPVSEQPQKDSAAPARHGIKKPGPLTWIFNKDTRLGRTNRSIVRTTGWVIGFFALGFLAVYLLLYVPLSQDYEKLSQDYLNAQQQFKTAQAGFKSTQETSSKVQNTLAQVKIARDVLDINNQVLQIELAVAQHDDPGSAYYLKKLQASVETALPEINKIDPDLAKVLEARVNVVAVELSSDPKAAQADLQEIIKYLQTLITRVSP